jgi:hypothetical protein
MVMIDADIIGSQLEEHKIWRAFPQNLLISFQETQIFSRVMTTLALIEDSSPQTFGFKNISQISWVAELSDTIACTHDDYALRGWAAKREQVDKHEDQTGFPFKDEYSVSHFDGLFYRICIGIDINHALKEKRA